MEEALNSIFNLQRAELINRRKEVEREHDEKIAKLKRNLCDAQAAKEDALNTINKEFLPAGSFSEPYYPDFTAECWRMYLDDCTTHGVSPDECDDVALRTVIVTYGYIVRQRRVVAYLEENDNLGKLTHWINRKIIDLFCNMKTAPAGTAAAQDNTPPEFGGRGDLCFADTSKV